MNSFIKYRISALLLVLVFSLFNIGLPIVVASCPMNENTNAAVCGSCTEQTSDVKGNLTSAKNTSCCATVIAAEKNSTEFVHVKIVLNEFSKSLVTSYTPVNRPIDYAHDPLISDQGSSPPRSIDIPIFTSSLLI